MQVFKRLNAWAERRVVAAGAVFGVLFALVVLGAMALRREPPDAVSVVMALAFLVFVVLTPKMTRDAKAKWNQDVDRARGGPPESTSDDGESAVEADGG